MTNPLESILADIKTLICPKCKSDIEIGLLQKAAEPKRRAGVRVIVTGQTGLDKKNYLQNITNQEYVKPSERNQIKLTNIGDEMYLEANQIGAKIPRNKILNLPISLLSMLRRSVLKDLILNISRHPNHNIIVNTHSSFRWDRGLVFSGFDFDLLEKIDPDMYITIIDDVDSIYMRLAQEDDPQLSKLTLKDILVWREEEMYATEIIAKLHKRQHYVIARNNPQNTIYKLMFERPKRAYLSFPISKILDKPEILREVDDFKKSMWKHMVVFDPIAIGERNLLRSSIKAKQQGKNHITVRKDGIRIRIRTSEIESVRKDIDGQIIARDFKLIEQSDMVVAYIPEVGGKPDISAGVQSELQYAHDLPRQVYVIWASTEEPSPWIEGMATHGKVFRGKLALENALKHFKLKGFIQSGKVSLDS